MLTVLSREAIPEPHLAIIIIAVPPALTIARTGDSYKRSFELIDHMGHDSVRAAPIYLHGSDARRQAIADTLSQLTRDELNQGSGGKPGWSARNRPGTQRAPRRSLVEGL